jgi:hypothetical protein
MRAKEIIEGKVTESSSVNIDFDGKNFTIKNNFEK